MNLPALKITIAKFLNRDDLTDMIPTFIELAEARINRIIRSRNMEYRVTAVIDKQFSMLPADFLEMRNIQVNSWPVTALEYVTPQAADALRANHAAGASRYFSIVGNRLELIPVPGAAITIEMTYFRKVPSLTDTLLENWLLSAHPDVYIYGVLTQAAAYLRDDPTIWASFFDSAVDEMADDNVRSQFHGTTPVQRGARIG